MKEQDEQRPGAEPEPESVSPGDVPPAGEIDSTYQRLTSKPTGYTTTVAEGTHVWGDFTVTRVFTLILAPRPDVEDTLRVVSRYEVDGREVARQEESWDIDPDDGSVLHSGESIGEFARSNHFLDPQLDIEIAVESAVDADDRERGCER